MCEISVGVILVTPIKECIRRQLCKLRRTEEESLRSLDPMRRTHLCSAASRHVHAQGCGSNPRIITKSRTSASVQHHETITAFVVGTHPHEIMYLQQSIRLSRWLSRHIHYHRPTQSICLFKLAGIPPDISQAQGDAKVDGHQTCNNRFKRLLPCV